LDRIAINYDQGGKNMHYLKRVTEKKGEEAVSPVVGVMLMLVVTIIIAAVVSGFAGNLVSGQQKSPTLSMNVKIANTGGYVGSGFSANVVSVSEPIKTSNIKIVTSWTTTMKNGTSVDLVGTSLYNMATGTLFTGGNTSLPNTPNINMNPGMNIAGVWSNVTVPFGIGEGIANTNPTSCFSYNSSWFGQYTLQPGVNLFAYPYGTASGSAVGGYPGQADNCGYNGAVPYSYVSGTDYVSGYVDPMAAVLGTGWENLRAGDIVHFKVIYTPTGATIFSKDVAVTEA
jgi:FlaG/FlaF family flagellin (archaellin)